MKKSSKTGNKAAAVRVDPYLEGLMAKLLERLLGIEKQLNTVIAQTAGKPSGDGDSPKQVPPRHERTLYEAICADCHKVCEVPFRPSENRPVYCKECFARRKSGGSGNALPALTPVALAPKPVSKPVVSRQVPPPLPPRTRPAKKAKKKK